MASASTTSRHRPLVLAAAALGMLASIAAINWLLAKRTEKIRPPNGQFVEVDGVRLHYMERGAGKPLLLLHGNGSTVHDFVSSGLVGRFADECRVIAIDRPGFGHSERPRGRAWTPEEQADLIAASLRTLQVKRAAIFAHSWGTLVALALAIRHSEMVSCLVLESGFYYPNPRVDVAFFSIPALPVLGDVLLYTVWPLLARLFWRATLSHLFQPNAIDEEFAAYLKPLAVRPSQLRALTQDTAEMISAAARLSEAYDNLRIPCTFIAGEEDRIVLPDQAKAIHMRMLWSRMELVPKTGHMVHHSATERVTAALHLALTKYT